MLTLDDGIVFKIAENLINEENKLRLYSLNPIYQPYDLHVSQIREIWQFVNYISSELPSPMEPKDQLALTIEALGMM